MGVHPHARLHRHLCSRRRVLRMVILIGDRLEGFSLTAMRHVRHVLGSIAVPAEIAFPDKLPKTRSGKIMRRVLKAQELGREIGDISTLEE